jgi:hypothetical protein
LVKPLYEASKEGEWEPMVWGKEQEKGFKNKRALTNTSAVGLPDEMKPFFLHVRDRLGTADSCRSLDPAASFLALPGGLFIKAT